MRQTDSHRRPLAQSARNRNGSAQQPDQPLDYCQPEPCALHTVGRGRPFTGKLIERMLQELPGHADACIAGHHFDDTFPAFSARQLTQARYDAAARRRVFYGIADDIDEDFRHMGLVHIEIAMLEIIVFLKGQLLLRDLHIENGRREPQILLHIDQLLINDNPIVFDAGHLEHIIEDGQQLIAGRKDLRPALGLLGKVLRRPIGHFRKADDGIERRTDIMAHVEQKS